MNTKTILNIKTEKKLKELAQKTAKKIGVPLATIMNAFLKQFVLSEEITFSAVSHKPSRELIKIVEDARGDYDRGETFGPFETAEAMIESLER